MTYKETYDPHGAQPPGSLPTEERMAHTQPDWLAEMTTIENYPFEADLARGLAYGLAFVMPVWIIIIGSILAF